MALVIRSYRNTDAPDVCQIFAAHHQAAGLRSVLTPLSLEVCVLAKPYFSPKLSLLAQWQGKSVGWIQWGPAPDGAAQSVSTEQCIASALCIAPHPEEKRIAQELLAESLTMLRAAGFRQAIYCPPPPSSPYLAGLTQGDAMIGVPSLDARLGSWLSDGGWRVERTVTAWELELSRFHPPTDRMQIQIRRTGHVDRSLDEPYLPWYVASMLGHADPMGFQLTSRQSRSVLAEIVFWTLGHELVAQPDRVARLWPLDNEVCLAQHDQITFLVSEALRQLREDRVHAVQTVACDRRTDVARVLQRLGFQATLTGQVYSIPL